MLGADALGLASLDGARPLHPSLPFPLLVPMLTREAPLGLNLLLLILLNPLPPLRCPLIFPLIMVLLVCLGVVALLVRVVRGTLCSHNPCFPLLLV